MKNTRTHQLLCAFIVLGFTMASCSKVLSKRTDEEAWIDYRNETITTRNPAAIKSEPKSPALVQLKKEIDAIPARNILIKCGLSRGAQTCFETEMTRHFDESFRKVHAANLELKMADYRVLQKDFQKTFSYSSVLQDVDKFHQSLLSGIDLKSRESADDLFHQCDQDRNSDAQIERFDLFTGGVTDFPKSVYACLEKKWELELDTVLEENLARLGVELRNKETATWIRNRILNPVFESEIVDLGKKMAQEELKEFEREKSDWFRDFDFKKSEVDQVKAWAPRLREKYPYSPVEQWVSAHYKRHSS